ncbi:MAG: S26 family signal peptidase [Oligoflexia bacterium]|nr:S26 family signal peptidase [Oligoflexia bacterium]
MKNKLALRLYVRKLLILTVIVVCLRGTISFLSLWYDIRYQFTDSVPGVLYLIVKNKMPKKGDLAAFWPPPNKYYHHTCFIKYVKGIAGDYVKRDGERFYLNGEYIGEAKKYSRNGDHLVPSNGGLIAKGHYFMWTSHKDSYDGRYKEIGQIPSDRIIGTAYRLL